MKLFINQKEKGSDNKGGAEQWERLSENLRNIFRLLFSECAVIMVLSLIKTKCVRINNEYQKKRLFYSLINWYLRNFRCN